jgi:hypothetical protein
MLTLLPAAAWPAELPAAAWPTDSCCCNACYKPITIIKHSTQPMKYKYSLIVIHPSSKIPNHNYIQKSKSVI